MPTAFSRRALLHTTLRSSLGASLAAGLGQRAFAATPPAAPAARAVILLYMAGGPSHLDTFDLKPGRPGGGPFRPVRTAASGIQISEHLPRLGRAMKQIALIRSLTSKEGNHDRARHLMHTSYAPAGGVDHPAFGSLVSEARSRSDLTLPGYVAIGGPGQDSGFLSAAHSPFPVKNAQKPVKYLSRARGIDDERWRRRLDLWRALEDRFAAERGGGFARSRREVGEKAISLMSGGVDAFDLQREPEAIRARYGDTPFGAGCLMARRLVQVGVPFVEVTLTGWDTHEDNFERVKALSSTLDQGMSELLADLRASGLLSSTLVVWMGDFGRTPRINEKGGRDHHPAASSVLLAGAGVAGGQVIGATDDDGHEVCERPVTVADLYRTIAVLAGLDADRMRMSPAGRPIKTVDVGKPIAELI
ncbi:MAG TPA: DUF1501 domain-containing protein [Polyangia bacterium]